MDGPVDRTNAPLHRPPREFPPPVPAEELRIAAPPARAEGIQQSILYVLFPVVGSLGIFAFALVYKNKLFLYIACAMVALTVLFAFAMRWAQSRQGKQSRRRQRRRYREYLARCDAQLADVAGRQRAAAERVHPDPQRLWGIVLRREHLWERRPADEDVLTARVGRGPVPHASAPRVDLGHSPLVEHEQDLVDEAQALAAKWRDLDAMPVGVPLDAHRVLAISGPPERGRAVARALLAQLAIAVAPADVLLAAAVPEEEGAAVGADADEPWDWLKWLPHARTAERPLLARGTRQLAALLEDLVAPRLDELRTLRDAGGLAARAEQVSAPWLVLVLEGLEPGDARARLPLLREALLRAEALKVCVLCRVDRPGDEPPEATVLLRLPERGTATLQTTGPGGTTIDVTPDELALGAAEALARGLAPVRLEDREAEHGLDAAQGLLGLLGLPDPDAVDPATDWDARPRVLGLQATLGVTAQGEPLILDLKQAAEGGMGPHGLVIGATGSGKSELLKTLVTSLALTHPPELLSFVFVDYKGGAALAELGALPHTAGMITNLQRDLGLVDRMFEALHGEQERRQSLLRDAGNLDDVLQYRALRDQGHQDDLPPLPDLLVVIDEFGELLAARPEFLDLFVAIGRVGRSLGIHLLFSSQRFEEGRLRGLESHLRYRICLRTYSAIESKAVLGTPDAYLLPSDPGVGYLKVDTTVYERFRTALVAPPTAEAGGAGAGGATAVRRFDGAWPSGPSAPAAVGTDDGARSAQGVRRLVRRLDAVAEGRRVHQVWLPPLEPQLPLDAVPAPPAFWERDGAGAPPHGLLAALGAVDLPREQARRPLVLDLGGAGGHVAVVGAPQSGKSTVLRTLALSLARAHAPDEVQLAAIDLGGGLLRALRGLPHVRAVAGKSDRDAVRRIVGTLQDELARREEAFARLGLDSIADVRAARAAGTLDDNKDFPDILLLVDGWAALRREHQDLDFEVEALLGSGLTYGIHVVITAARWAEMRPSVADALGGRIELRLGDPLESEVDRRRAEAIPAGVPGRGLTVAGEELQVALPRLDGRAEAGDLGAATEAAAAAIAQRWDGPPAPPVHVLPALLRADDLPEDGAGSGVVVGIDEAHAAPVVVDPGGADPHVLVLGDGESGRTNLLRHLIRGLDGEVLVVDPRRTLADVADLPHVRRHATTAAEATEAAAEIAAEVQRRVAERDSAATPLHLVVDDYDLLSGPAGNPLAALAGVLAHGRDADVHVLLARRVAGTTRAAFEPVFQQLVELRSPTLILSGDPAEGPLVDGVRAQPLPPGRAVLVRRGRRPALVQTVQAPPLDAAGASSLPGETTA